MLYLFWQEILQSSIVWAIFSVVVYLFPKKRGFSKAFFQKYCDYFERMLADIHSFNGTVYFSNIKICSNPILLTHFLSVYFRTPVTFKQTSYQSNDIFRLASIILKWEQPLQAAIFLQKDFRRRSCLEQLLLSNNYFLATNTFSDQLLLEYKHFFNSTATFMFRRSYFFKISDYSKHVLFRSRQLVQTATVS